jgi:signal transduction histidine kinase
MAELHGGGLELVSAPGKGTTATVWLPPERVRAELRAVAD